MKYSTLSNSPREKSLEQKTTTIEPDYNYDIFSIFDVGYRLLLSLCSSTKQNTDTDKKETADTPDDADTSGHIEPTLYPVGNIAIEHQEGKRDHHQGGDENCELEKQRFVYVDKLREQGREKDDRFWIGDRNTECLKKEPDGGYT